LRNFVDFALSFVPSEGDTGPKQNSLDNFQCKLPTPNLIIWTDMTFVAHGHQAHPTTVDDNLCSKHKPL